jgi:hypothetical protein
MPSATFDGVNQLIQLPSVGDFDVERDLYSAWKVWASEGDNAKYLPAFETTGGDPVGGGQSIAPYFFCRNDLGWRVKMPAANGDVVLAGNLFARDPATALFVSNTGYDAFLRLSTSTQALTVTETDYTQTLSDIKASTNLIPALL